MATLRMMGRDDLIMWVKQTPEEIAAITAAASVASNQAVKASPRITPIRTRLTARATSHPFDSAYGNSS